jgi:LPPG:FO 2-phospho-L-lactate transferase
MQRVLAISGGVGGAKLALGLQDVLIPESLAVLVNTGDDFVHCGLHISPDVDTLLYTLSGRSNAAQGWGLEGESWEVMTALDALGGETWFRLGDRDLATHLWRTQALAGGAGLAAVTDELRRRLGIACAICPMSDDPVRTLVHTAEGDLAFQHYFVKYQCRPAVTGFSFAGATRATPNPQVLEWLADPALGAVIICPSNPFVSVDPILAVPGYREALAACGAPVIAVSPIVAGAAIKGPAAKMMGELGLAVTAQAVAEHYRGLIDGFVVDSGDATLAAAIRRPGLEVMVLPTLMTAREEKQRLARDVLRFAGVAAR